ncbi:hypothetical protein [Variovorax sp. PBL-E5]|uniref:hypothetical protein n=1 Tax=Variovorax sp. PBL-E5 TaxID=434014 RepID=UPI0013160867|nr:hypothetical protein [Variovorax sp. PBL-E5]VTU36995.1 hypothetical protein E5CHR_04457 [Variovorax sp. PBL-E5]
MALFDDIGAAPAAAPAASGGGRLFDDLDAPAPKADDGSSSRFLHAAALIPGIGPLAALGVKDSTALGGLISGFADTGSTLLNQLAKPAVQRAAALVPGVGALAAVNALRPDLNSARQASLDAFNQAHEGETGFTPIRVAGNILATAPVGGALGEAAGGVASAASLAGGRVLPAIGRFLAPVADATGSGGMTAGGVTGLASVPARMAGGAISGGAQAALVDPGDANGGAAIGALLPPALAGAEKASAAVPRLVRGAFAPTIAKDARSILDAGGLLSSDLGQVRAALSQQGPSIVQAPLTVPQILQNPGISQFARTLDNSGDTALQRAAAAQETARQAALGRISPVTGTPLESAQQFGNVAGPQIVAGDAAARAKTDLAFKKIDPDQVTAFELPIGNMQAQADTYLGPGTFGMGSKAQQALSTAREIGQQTLEAPTVAKVTKGGPTVFDAVKAAGGINSETPAGQAFAGELRDLTQSGLRGVVKKGTGQSLDKLASRLHEAGFLEDDDPATLLNALRDHAAGESAVSNSADADAMFRGRLEASQGEPPSAITIPKAIPFAQVQNLRSSLSAAARGIENSSAGANAESAALRKMIGDIDSRVQAVADGRGNFGENFPPETVQQWQDALQAKRDQVHTFRTGPQASLFRKGGDNQAAVQGAELAPKFWNAGGSQADDLAAFGKVATPQTTSLLKNYAVTQAANQTDRLGNLTNTKFGDWLKAHSIGIPGLFNEGEQATLRGVGSNLATADAAASLGMAKGSPTAKNLQNALNTGVLGHPAIGIVAAKLPYGSQVLSALQGVGKQGRVDRLGALMADPEALAKAVAAYQALNRPLGLAGLSDLNRLAVRSAPLLSTAQ